MNENFQICFETRYKFAHVLSLNLKNYNQLNPLDTLFEFLFQLPFQKKSTTVSKSPFEFLCQLPTTPNYQLQQNFCPASHQDMNSSRAPTRKSNCFFIFFKFYLRLQSSNSIFDFNLQILSSTSIFALLAPDCHFKLI